MASWKIRKDYSRYFAAGSFYFFLIALIYFLFFLPLAQSILVIILLVASFFLSSRANSKPLPTWYVSRLADSPFHTKRHKLIHFTGDYTIIVYEYEGRARAYYYHNRNTYVPASRPAAAADVINKVERMIAQSHHWN